MYPILHPILRPVTPGPPKAFSIAIGVAHDRNHTRYALPRYDVFKPPWSVIASLLYISIVSFSPLSRTEIAGLQIPRHGRQLDHQAGHLRGQDDLAAQPTRLGQAERQVKHVVLVIIRFRHLLVVLLVLHDNMASRACAGSAAGTYTDKRKHVSKNIPVKEKERASPCPSIYLGGRGGHSVPSISRSCAWATSSRLSPLLAAILCSSPSLSINVTQISSPALGGSMWPCLAAGVEEKARAAAAGLDRHIRRAFRCFWGRADARGNVIEEEVLLNWRVVEVDAHDGLRRIKVRVNTRGVDIVG